MSFFGLMRPDEVLMELGSRMQRHRLKQNMTQDDLARRLGVSVPTVSSLENGKNTTLETFIKVVFALGLQNELQDLFSQPTPTIAELERLSAKPKRQRASARVKPAVKVGEPKSVVAPASPRAKLWDRKLFNTDEGSSD